MSREKKGGAGKFVFGALVGAGLGLIFAPKKGSELRGDLKKKIDELLTYVKNIDTDEVKSNIEQKIEELREELEDLDKEKVLKIAKKKGEELKKKAEELVILAKEKGTPIVQDVAKEVKAKTIFVVKEVLKKLESE